MFTKSKLLDRFTTTLEVASRNEVITAMGISREYVFGGVVWEVRIYVRVGSEYGHT